MIKRMLEEDDNDGHASAYEMQSEDFEAIQGLLDLYNKEKEKNKTLETLLQGNLYQMYLYYKELAGRYQANSISKDKIKAKIEELENQKKQWIEDRDNKHKDSEIIYAIEVLQSLLEKE